MCGEGETRKMTHSSKLKFVVSLLNYKNLKAEKRVGHKIAKNYIFLIEFFIGLASFILYNFLANEPFSWTLLPGIFVGELGLGAFIGNTKEFLERGCNSSEG